METFPFEPGNSYYAEELERDYRRAAGAPVASVALDGGRDLHNERFLSPASENSNFLLTCAVSMGAPFWFDVLNKVSVVRSTIKPQEPAK